MFTTNNLDEYIPDDYSLMAPVPMVSTFPDYLKVCEFASNGCCRYGPNCKNYHMEDDIIGNCGIYVQNIDASVTLENMVHLAKTYGGDLYLKDKQTGSAGVRFLPSNRPDGRKVGFVNFTKQKYAKAFIYNLKKNVSDQFCGMHARMNKPFVSDTPAASVVVSKICVDDDGFQFQTPKHNKMQCVVCDKDNKENDLKTIRDEAELDNVSLSTIIADRKRNEASISTDSVGTSVTNKQRSILDMDKVEKRRAKDGNWYTEQEFHDYYPNYEHAAYQWDKAIRNTKVHDKVSWVDVLMPGIQKQYIDEWGIDLETKYDIDFPNISSVAASTSSALQQDKDYSEIEDDAIFAVSYLTALGK